MAKEQTAFRLPPVMGHRGAAGHAPENTLISIRRAAEAGRRAILGRYNWEYDTATLIRTLQEAVAGHDAARARKVG